MDVRNCRQCGRLFNYLSGPPICQACRDALEEKFQQVKEYVRSNPGATIQMVSEDNDVSVKQIKQWIREERLVISNGMAEGIVCENCGRPIHTGRFCESCKKTMVQDLSNAFEKPKPAERSLRTEKENDRMRFLK